MNNIITPILIARKAVKRNAARTILTIVGVVIGIASVVTIFSAGEGIKAFVLREVEAFGSNIIQIEIKVPSTSHQSPENAMGQAMGVAITTLKHSDTKELLKIGNINNGYSGALGQAIIQYKNINKSSLLLGATSEFIDIDISKIEKGRFYTADEDNSATPVVVLGYKLNEKIFGDEPSLDKFIKLKKQRFKVIGVMKERGSSMFFDWDNLAFLPLQTLQKKISGTDYVSYIIVTLDDIGQQELTKMEIEDILRDRHDIDVIGKTEEDRARDDDFAVTTQEEMQGMLSDILDGITLLLTAIAFISLIVSGVGIMNIMYVSVFERTFEIGLRKSVGANNMSIFLQFLWEALYITFVGGIAGIILGIIFTYAISVLAAYFNFAWPFIIHWNGVAIAVIFSAIIGLIFGLYPAIKASKLDPIGALRNE